MPRAVYSSEPQIINFANTSHSSKSKILEIATTNRNKLSEFTRILKDYKIIGKDLKTEEIQSTDPIKVVSQKAKDAFVANANNPILVEDTSLEIKSLNNLPGTYANDFLSQSQMREQIAKIWLKKGNREAIARVVLAIYDGAEVYTWEGKVAGAISRSPIGTNGFGWDDIFIPNGSKKTFAQMPDSQKDAFSMRAQAIKKFLKKPIIPAHPILMLPEPYEQELKRVQPEKLTNKQAQLFANSLEDNPSNPINSEENIYYTRFISNKSSSSLGLLLTDVDRKHLKFYKNGKPVLWQMGPERRSLALAQRTEFFMTHQNTKVIKTLNALEKNKNNFPKRSNARSHAIEEALNFNLAVPSRAISPKEIGYKKLSSNKEVSRTVTAQTGLYSIIGKYARSIYGVGSGPFTSGWHDVITMAALGHMMGFIPRNNIFAVDTKNQINLANQIKQTIKALGLSKHSQTRAFNNIGASLGTNPAEDTKQAKLLYKNAGIKLFRIYTINSDPRIIKTAYEIRQALGDDVEIFVGQLVDKKQALKLTSADIKADGLVYGHGGGRQCTSATNGMALSTLEELYEVLIDKSFNDTSILVEGGVGSSVGCLLMMGVDCILRNAQFANCVIEQGNLFFEHKSGKVCQPHHGSASAASMIIESMNPSLVPSRLSPSGRTKNVEGKPGYIFYQEKANSMAFFVDQFQHYAARTLVDLGVESIPELREFLSLYKKDLFRIVSTEAQSVSSAYGTF